MKRYALFAWVGQYPYGGWNDYRNSYDTAEEARAAGESYLNSREEWDWSADRIYQIVDLTTGMGICGGEIKENSVKQLAK